MASSVFFRFKSQKEPTRVTFDGTGISVFELKREIITISRLGDGTDFELTLSSSDSNEVYDDDTAIVPRSTTVIARRLPAARPGKGGAARYVSGKMPVNGKNSHRSENASKAIPKTPITTAMLSNVSNNQTEEERMAAVLQMGADQWQQQKQQMASATPVLRSGGKGKPANVPDHDPPAGYTCHRCSQKGHWIQACPTNDDPKFEGQPRVKRTTGIPKSFLRTIEDPRNVGDGLTEDVKLPSGVMQNAEGEFVVAEPDKVSWEQYQAKANRSAAAQKEAALGSQEVRDRGLECSMDKRLFVEPTKTPCCQTTYCNECITNALLDDDLQCPHCGKEGILIDDLQADDETLEKIRKYEEEKAREGQPEVSDQNASTGDENAPTAQTRRLSDSSSTKSQERTPKSPDHILDPKQSEKSESRKRKAESELENDRKSPTPATSSATKDKPLQKPIPTGPKADAKSGPVFPPELAFMNQLPLSNGNIIQGMSGFQGMPMNMPIPMPMPMPISMNMNMMGTNPAMWNQVPMMNGTGGQWNGMNGMNGMNGINGMNGMFPQQTNGMFGMNSQGGMPSGMNNTHGMAQGIVGGRGGTGGFANQQRNNFNSARPVAEESAYFRQPVNPQRHQGRRNNFQRPADYREI